MKILKKDYVDHSVSHGTMKTEHVLPKLVAFIKVHSKLCKIEIAYSKLQEKVDKLEYEDDDNYDYNSLNSATEILFSEVFFIMNDLAPKGCYFGSHTGDRSDYGFWKLEVI